MVTPTKTPLKFVFFPPSPWSERARWALDHSGVTYDTIIFTPLISNAYVRWLSRNISQKLTIPVAIDNNQQKTILRDSFEIAEHSNNIRLSDRENIFPKEHLEEIIQWHKLSEQLLDILRVRANPRMKNSKALQLNNLPPIIPDSIKPLFLPMSRFALDYFEKKYPLPPGDHQKTLIDGLEKIREATSNSTNGYLLDQFSFADITIAVVFQAIKPGKNTFVPIEDATRECWKDPELSQHYKDLLQWRDSIYEKHRTTAEPLTVSKAPSTAHLHNN